MKRLDAHLHALNGKPDPEELLRRFEAAGIWGGCVFSNWPVEGNAEIGTSFEARMEELQAWTQGYEDRLFPILWIHPDEENVLEKVQQAVDAGVCGFKMICSNYDIYEERCLTLLRKIASLNKPVLFHSGVLWDGQVSSAHNRPLNWEALMPIEGLRFSMGHCSWPWLDECIALYGKFLNSRTMRNTAEMFFDITPGTPEIYRRELLHKLYEIGYDVGDNVFFGCDCTAHDYRSEWAAKWLEIDGRILDSIGVSEVNRQKLYYDNLMRFLGKTPVDVTHALPVSDDANSWSPRNPQVPQIIEDWYRKLGIPRRYDREFYQALAEIPVADTLTADRLQDYGPDGARNLLETLFVCQKLQEGYAARGIPESVLLDTLADIPKWLDIWSDYEHRMFLGEIHWLKNSLRMKLFKLGILQFAMDKAGIDVPELGITANEDVLWIHIDGKARLTPEACRQSLAAAKDFFARYYPEYQWRHFLCHTWILDPNLREILPPQSNLIQFQQRFHVAKLEESDDIRRFVFPWGTTRSNVRYAPCVSSLAKAVRDRMLADQPLYEGIGVLQQDQIDLETVKKL